MHAGSLGLALRNWVSGCEPEQGDVVMCVFWEDSSILCPAARDRDKGGFGLGQWVDLRVPGPREEESGHQSSFAAETELVDRCRGPGWENMLWFEHAARGTWETEVSRGQLGRGSGLRAEVHAGQVDLSGTCS